MMIQVSGLTTTQAFDGEHTFLTFGLANPATDQSTVTIAVPTGLLPQLAMDALRRLPQPDPGLNPVLPWVLPVETVTLGNGPQGQIALVVAFNGGTSMSFGLSGDQAASVFEGLAAVLGLQTTGSPPSGLN